MRSLLAKLCSLGLGLGLLGVAHATTYNVPTDYASIQAAINDAAVVSGDVITVTAPKTEGGFSISNGKNLTIQKTGAGQVLMTNQCNLQGAITARVEGIDITSPNLGVYVDGNSSITLSNCSINGTSGNSAVYVATTGAGILRIADSTLQYSGAGTIDAVQYNGAGILTLDHTSVIDAGRIGVLMATTANTTLNVINGSVVGNAPQFGIWGLASGVTINVSDSSVSTNTMDGIYMESVGATLNCTNTTIHNNTRFGIWFARAANSTLTNCTVRNNGNMGIYRNANAGAAMTLTMNGGVVRNNGSNGGLDFTEIATLNLNNVQFLNNNNFGMFLRDRCVGPLTMNGCTFAGNSVNTVRYTGQTNASPMRATISNSIFRDGTNNAQANFWSINGSSNTRFINCIFDEGNSLLNVQPALANTSASATVDYCTFISRAGVSFAGIIAAGDTDDTRRVDVTVRNSIISGPSNGLYVAGASANKFMTNNYNLMNAATNYAGCSAGANDRTGDPKFITATSGVGTADLHLQNTLPPSPAIDAASVALVPDVTNDIAGTTRPLPAGTAPDMGAYEETLVPVELSNFEVL